MSVTGAAFTVFYSLMWGADISNKWLTSILVSLVQDILITQPIKVLALAALLSLLIRKPPEEDPIIGASLFKSVKGERVAAKRKQRKDLVHEKDTISKKWDMIQTVQEVVSFLIFGFLLMIVSYGDLDNARFQFTKSTGDLFGGFEEVRSVLNCMIHYSFCQNWGAGMVHLHFPVPPGFEFRSRLHMWVPFSVDSCSGPESLSLVLPFSYPLKISLF